MNRAIVTLAIGEHEKMLEIAAPSYRAFAKRHGWELFRATDIGRDRPPPWYKLQALMKTLPDYDEVLLLDADTLIVDGREDLTAPDWAWQAMVNHHTGDGFVPNTGVWLCRKPMLSILERAWDLTEYIHHGWWEQAAVMHLMGWAVNAPAHLVEGTELHKRTHFLNASWNVHVWDDPQPEHHRILHATMYRDRCKIMLEWAKRAEVWMNE
jgi:hypothetical protein